MTSRSEWCGSLALIGGNGMVTTFPDLGKQAIINHLYKGRISRVQIMRDGHQIMEFNSVWDAASFLEGVGVNYPRSTVVCWPLKKDIARR